MAIFAKKKHGRRQNHEAADGTTSGDIVHIEVPDRYANDGVLTKASMAIAAGTESGNRGAQEHLGRESTLDAKPGATPETKLDGKTDTKTDGKTDTRTDGTAAVKVEPPREQESDSGAAISLASPAAGTAAPAAESPVPSVAVAGASAAPEIEPVDIEPEVIEAPAEPPLVFGIADAIRLMRSLPADPNIDLVVRVVRVTLGAVNVSVDDILRDAEKKELKVRESIAALEDEVAALEKTLYDKRASIAAHQADLRETATVRERLHMADKYTPHPPPLPPDALRVPLPKPREWESFDPDLPFKTKDS